MGFFDTLIERGHKEGNQVLVSRLLEKRFGTLPVSVQERIQDATPEELEHWAMRMLEVDSLEAVFRD